MTSLYQTVKACIVKTPPSEQVEFVTRESEEQINNPENLKENDAEDFSSNKKTDEQSESKQQSGIVWRVSSGLGSGLYNVTTGAVGYGVGGVKWVAGKGYDVGSAVGTAVSNRVPALPGLAKKKDKKE